VVDSFRRWHRLKRRKYKPFPEQIVVIDTETACTTNRNGVQTLRLKLGVGLYVSNERKNRKARYETFQFVDADSFWKWLVNTAEKDRTLMLVGFNLAFDLRIVSAWSILSKLGYKPVNLYLNQGVFLARWKKGKSKLLAVDARNWFRGSLQQWAEYMGQSKVPVNWSNVDDKTLWLRCRKDVMILYELYCRWCAFIEGNDIGGFASTLSGQAWQAFRYRFMHRKLYIHGHSAAIALERDAYKGGRAECFRIGKFSSGPFYLYDVNSIYPYVMTTTPVPIKLISYSDYVSVADLTSAAARHGVIAKVCLKTNIPAFAVKTTNGTVFPIGTFDVSLATPEVLYAIKHAEILRVYSMAVYSQQKIFNEYIDTLYTMRNKFKAAKSKLWSEIAKYLMLGLYGKFGQKSESCQAVPNIPELPDGAYDGYDATINEYLTFFVIAGQRYNVVIKGEAYDSFPAIAATITAAARLYLWKLITVAGIEHIYYCDTDSLMVDRVGSKALQPYVNPSRLGYLKCEAQSDRLEIYTPKDYIFGTKRRIKGIRSDATEIATGVWQTTHFVGLRGAIRAANVDGQVLVIPVTKHLAREYRKGIVHSSGVVTPLVFDASRAAV